MRPAPRLANIARQRLRTQRITGPGFANPADAVRWFGAVQARDYAAETASDVKVSTRLFGRLEASEARALANAVERHRAFKRPA